MKISRVIRHIENGDIHAAGENLGNELSRNRLMLLKKARAELSKFQRAAAEDDNRDDYDLGYIAAMLDIIAAYESAIENK